MNLRNVLLFGLGGIISAVMMYASMSAGIDEAYVVGYNAGSLDGERVTMKKFGIGQPGPPGPSGPIGELVCEVKS